ncbi:hypothetical protein E4T56_gene16437, partial [Termitomyces sp. T112]
RAAQEGVTIRALTGESIRPEHWDAFWRFYQDTGSRKWGHPYLTRQAFDLLGERMADRILLVLAFIDDRAVAGALNFIGRDCLYGRYWGAIIDKPFLHFELCYYQAIDAAIALGLSRVEAGAQGGHKLARGYAPRGGGLPAARTPRHCPGSAFSGDPNAFPASRCTPFRRGVWPRWNRGESGRAAVAGGYPLAGAALGLGNLAGGHFLGYFGAAGLGFLMPADGGQIEPFMRLDQIAGGAMAAGGKGHAQIEIGIGRQRARQGAIGPAAHHHIIILEQKPAGMIGRYGKIDGDEQIGKAAIHGFDRLAPHRLQFEPQARRYSGKARQRVGQQHLRGIIRGHDTHLPISAGRIEGLGHGDCRADLIQHRADRLDQIFRPYGQRHLPPLGNQQFVTEIIAQPRQRA